jgi:fructose-1,6-bisphosphatase/sedoheptulose 1,7-bisphosphatase-like protein
MTSSPSKISTTLDRILALEIARVTESAAVAAARLCGRGDEKAADQKAVDAMRREMNNLPIVGTVVIGEGERDKAPMLFIGEKVGSGHGPLVDIAVDPFKDGLIETETVVMRAATGTVRWIRAEHRQLEKFDLQERAAEGQASV